MVMLHISNMSWSVICGRARFSSYRGRSSRPRGTGAPTMNQLVSSPDQTILPTSAANAAPHGRVAAFVATTDSVVPSLLRVGLGGVILGHGLQKLFGWFGGYGLDGTMKFFASLGMPSVVGALVIASDFLGSLAVVVGLA